MQLYRDTFNCPVGLSDHSLGIASAIIAASLGAAVIEKHFTTDKFLVDKIPDADHDISIVPKELEELKSFCENVQIMIGTDLKKLSEGETKGRSSFRRGLYAKRDIVKGEELDLKNVILLRPVSGISAGCWDDIAGKKFVKNISKHQSITYSDLGL